MGQEEIAAKGTQNLIRNDMMSGVNLAQAAQAFNQNWEIHFQKIAQKIREFKKI